MRFLSFAFHVILSLAGLLVAMLTLAGALVDVDPRLDIVNHFRLPLFAAGLALLGLALLAWGTARLFAATLAAGILFAQGSVVVPEFLAAQREPVAPASDEAVVTLATYNVLQGRIDVEALARWVEGEGIDILVLQEVGDDSRRVTAPLRTLMPQVHAPGGNVAILSRWPLVKRRVGELGPRSAGGLPGEGSASIPLVAAEATVPGIGPVTIAGVHLGWPAPAGRRQPREMAFLREQTTGDQGPTILAGDFNATPFGELFRRFEAALPYERLTRGLPTFPTPVGVFRMRPPAFLPIDHVFASRQFRALSVERGPHLGSDHYPVLVRLGKAGKPGANDDAVAVREDRPR